MRYHSFNYNYGRPDFKLPYRSGLNDDLPLTLPIAPKNAHVTSPYLIGVIDIRWDNPNAYAENNGINVLGVNVYKAYDSPEASYTRINTVPIGALYCRDQTSEVYVNQEDPMVGGRLITGTNATGDWVAHTYYKPIIIPGTNGEVAENSKHVVVEVKKTALDTFQTVPAFKVVGETGEVFLINRKIYNSKNNTFEAPVLPDLNAGGEVRISYTYIDNHIQTNIDRKIYYKVTTVAECPDTHGLIETPLSEVEAVSLYDIEKIDYIWAEAIRRNRWILEQGGERVKVFIRKWSGIRCPVCWSEEYQQGREDCQNCYGTGYAGGYEGPISIIIAPPESEKTVQLMDVGLHLTYDFNTWTSPYPLLNDRDFLVRQNNYRLSIAHVNPQGSRGAIYQQHFMVSPLDTKDIRYRVPINGGEFTTPEAWDAYRKSKPSDASPVIPQKPEIPDQYRKTGKTVSFENLMY